MIKEPSGFFSQSNSEYRYILSAGVRLWGISLIVERERAQTVG
jgi:hypothetical protein